MRLTSVTHEFVEKIPASLQEGKIYISIPYATAVHKCCCGCGNEVVTPLSSTDWELSFNGETISLNPSIGNWGFSCQSHYWIEQNKIRWAPKWNREKVDTGRLQERFQKERYFESKNEQRSYWSKVKEWILS